MLEKGRAGSALSFSRFGDRRGAERERAFADCREVRGEGARSSTIGQGRDGTLRGAVAASASSRLDAGGASDTMPRRGRAQNLSIRRTEAGMRMGECDGTTTG